jgi:tRNA threonylcarbamoyl adenosine modification protein YeaZ
MTNGGSCMRILAVEFSSSCRSAAVIDAGQVVSRAVEEGGRVAGPNALVADVLGQAGLEPAAIDCVAVGLGPGSYTGIRVAIAVAQGWELARGVSLLGLSSVECLAWQMWLGGAEGRLTVLVDAQRGEFYAAGYRLTVLTVERDEPLMLCDAAEVERRVARGDRLAGPDLGAAQWPVTPMLPDAAMLGVLASRRNQFVPGAGLQPIYLRETRFVKAPAPRVIPILHSGSASEAQGGARA